jgi:hypothetical protein
MPSEVLERPCPKCGAVGKGLNGEHEAAVREGKFLRHKVIDVGWRCWKCGFEWGFDELEEDAR